MLAKRIIACLDIKDGRTVKGINFLNIKDAGDAVEMARRYSELGIDELVFLDISATNEKRKTLCTLVSQIAEHINIPFTVGGGIRCISDAALLIKSGADKISINTAAVNNPDLITSIASNFGSQAVVVAIDVKKNEAMPSGYEVCTYGGKTPAGIDALLWAKEAEKRGAGEILLTSMDRDGTKNGFDVDLNRIISSNIYIPLIASGGAGKMEDFLAVFTSGKADAALAASVFHYHEIDIRQLKLYLSSNGVSVRS